MTENPLKKFKVSIYGTYTEDHYVEALNEDFARQLVLDKVRFNEGYWVDDVFVEEESEDENGN
jgi:hypothetical protein